MQTLIRNLPEEERVSWDARNRDVENAETVQKPFMAYILSKGLQGIKALVEAKSPVSLLATVARIASITYGGAFTDLVLRGCTKLGDVAEML